MLFVNDVICNSYSNHDDGLALCEHLLMIAEKAQNSKSYLNLDWLMTNDILINGVI